MCMGGKGVASRAYANQQSQVKAAGPATPPQIIDGSTAGRAESSKRRASRGYSGLFKNAFGMPGDLSKPNIAVKALLGQ